MPIKRFRPTTPTQRYKTVNTFSEALPNASSARVCEPTDKVGP